MRPEVARPEMSEAHASDAMTGPHGSMDDHGESHGHDDHAHSGSESSVLGPVDVQAWGAGLIGIVLGLLVALAIGVASGSVGV
jgi:hypothetical protein